jgi:hypothetical protein
LKPLNLFLKGKGKREKRGYMCPLINIVSIKHIWRKRGGGVGVDMSGYFSIHLYNAMQYSAIQCNET